MKLYALVIALILVVVAILMLLLGMTKSPFHGLLAAVGIGLLAFGAFMPTLKWYGRIGTMASGLLIVVLAMAM